MDIGEPKVSALVAERQFFVIHAHQMHDRGVQIVDMHWIGRDVVAIVVCFAVCVAASDSGTRHQHGKAARVVITAIIRFRQVALRINCSAKLTAPDDQRVV